MQTVKLIYAAPFALYHVQMNMELEFWICCNSLSSGFSSFFLPGIHGYLKNMNLTFWAWMLQKFQINVLLLINWHKKRFWPFNVYSANLSSRMEKQTSNIWTMQAFRYRLQRGTSREATWSFRTRPRARTKRSSSTPGRYWSENASNWPARLGELQQAACHHRLELMRTISLTCSSTRWRVLWAGRHLGLFTWSHDVRGWWIRD